MIGTTECLLLAFAFHPFLLIIPFGIIAVIVFVGGIMRAKQRTQQFVEVAEELGLPFFPQGDDGLLGRLSDFHLFSQGRSKRIMNMLHGETNEVEVAIFDYRYTVGSGKDRKTYHQSVIYFHSATLQLPTFAVRPEGMFHKIGALFGYKDIDFESHPLFSKKYLLRGDNEAAIRELFDDRLLSFFEGETKISVEGSRGQLVYYRQKKRIKPADTQNFMKEGFQIFALFRD